MNLDWLESPAFENTVLFFVPTAIGLIMLLTAKLGASKHADRADRIVLAAVALWAVACAVAGLSGVFG